MAGPELSRGQRGRKDLVRTWAGQDARLAGVCSVQTDWPGWEVNVHNSCSQVIRLQFALVDNRVKDIDIDIIVEMDMGMSFEQLYFISKCLGIYSFVM